MLYSTFINPHSLDKYVHSTHLPVPSCLLFCLRCGCSLVVSSLHIPDDDVIVFKLASPVLVSLFPNNCTCHAFRISSIDFTLVLLSLILLLLLMLLLLFVSLSLLPVVDVCGGGEQVTERELELEVCFFGLSSCDRFFFLSTLTSDPVPANKAPVSLLGVSLDPRVKRS